jgi:heme/copper-type cytochrome/quinol oxidase subunit 2
MRHRHHDGFIIFMVIAVIVTIVVGVSQFAAWRACEADGGTYVEAFPTWDCIDKEREVHGG